MVAVACASNSSLTRHHSARNHGLRRALSLLEAGSFPAMRGSSLLLLAMPRSAGRRWVRGVSGASPSDILRSPRGGHSQTPYLGSSSAAPLRVLVRR